MEDSRAGFLLWKVSWGGNKRARWNGYDEERESEESYWVKKMDDSNWVFTGEGKEENKLATRNGYGKERGERWEKG